MVISHKKLWKLLINRDIKKKDLHEAAGICQSPLSKIARSENITMRILLKICSALHCEVGDILEIIAAEKDS